MNKAQLAAAELLRSRLDPKHPLFTGSPEVAAALSAADAGFYFQSWVLPLIDYLIAGEQWPGHAASIKRERDWRVAAAQARARYEAADRAQKVPA